MLLLIFGYNSPPQKFLHERITDCGRGITMFFFEKPITNFENEQESYEKLISYQKTEGR